MSAYDTEIENKTNKCVNYALGILKRLEEDCGFKIDDNHKAQLIGQLAVAASIESLVVYANRIGENFASEFFQKMIGSGVATAFANIGKQSDKKVQPAKKNKRSGEKQIGS